VAGNVWYPRTQQSVLKATYLGEKRTRHALAAIHTMALRVGMFKKTRSHHPKDEIVVSAVPKIRAIGLKKTQSCLESSACPYCSICPCYAVILKAGSSEVETPGKFAVPQALV